LIDGADQAVSRLLEPESTAFNRTQRFSIKVFPDAPLLENIERGPFCGSSMSTFRNFKNRLAPAKRFPFFGIPDDNPEK
jgi:hypothetical protein